MNGAVVLGHRAGVVAGAWPGSWKPGMVGSWNPGVVVGARVVVTAPLPPVDPSSGDVVSGACVVVVGVAVVVGTSTLR